MNVAVRLLRLTPTEAELRFEPSEPAMKVRGRVVGPNCLYSTTIDVVYPLRNSCVHIPEPAWWDPESPFLYRAILECWIGADKVHDVQLRIGLRHTVFDGEYFIHNGKRVDLRAERLATVNEVQMKSLRADGRNAVEVPGSLADAAYAIAERIGLFVLTDGGETVDPLLHPSALIR